MAQAAIIFKDSDDGVEVGIEIPGIEEMTEMTPSIYNASLISFIVERGYHTQFQDEFMKEYEKMMEEKEEKEKSGA